MQRRTRAAALAGALGLAVASVGVGSAVALASTGSSGVPHSGQSGHVATASSAASRPSTSTAKRPARSKSDPGCPHMGSGSRPTRTPPAGGGTPAAHPAVTEAA